MTVTPFLPTPLAPFQFQPTLDAAQYAASVTWNLFGQRWYVNLMQPSGALIVSEALVDTAPAVALASLTWGVNGQVATITAGLHNYLIGATAWLTIAGCAPAAYNGQVLAYITGPDSFTFPMTFNPGAPTALGAVSMPISMTGGYFGSTLTFDSASQCFNVLP